MEMRTSVRQSTISSFDSKGIKVATFSCCEISSTKLSWYVLYLTCTTCSGYRLRIDTHRHTMHGYRALPIIPRIIRFSSNCRACSAQIEFLLIKTDIGRLCVYPPSILSALPILSPPFFRYRSIFLNTQFLLTTLTQSPFFHS